MKNIFYILLLLPTIIFAQYPSNSGQKITLGEQTTADGLVYRGLAADTTRKPSVDTMAYIILDTTTNLIWHYKKGTSNAWLQAGGGVSVSSFSAGTTGLTPNTATTGAVTLGGTLAVANGGTNTSTAFTAGSVVFAGASGTYTQDNSGLFYDDTNDRLGIGTADPRAKLQISGGVLNTSSLTDLGLSSALTTGRSGVFQTGSLASINTRGDATSVELIAGVSADFYSGISATAKNASLFAGTLRLITAGLERMRISSTGNVGIGTESPTQKLHVDGNGLFTGNLGVGGATPTTSGTGITFPATQSASTNVNTLDDYEEGTWTPILGGNTSTSGQTYVYQIGRYTKIGRLVYCTFEVQLSTKGTITTRANILGLPFMTSGTGVYLDAGSVTISFFQDLASNQIYVSGYLIGDRTQIELTATNTATTLQNNLSASDAFNDNTRIAGTITYFAN